MEMYMAVKGSIINKCTLRLNIDVFLGFFFHDRHCLKKKFEYKKAAFKTIWWPDRDLRKLPK